MTQIIGLFSNQKEAEEAVEALTEAVLGEHDLRVIEKWEKTLDQPMKVLPISNPTSALSGVVGPRATIDKPMSQSSREAANFFRQSLKKGGVIVSVDLMEDRYRDRAKSVLQKQRAVAVAAIC